MKKAFWAAFITISILLPGITYAWSAEGGGDHGGADWTPACDTEIAGIHINIGTFTIPSSCIVYVKTYDGASYGTIFIYTDAITIAGTLNGDYRGYPGGLIAYQNGQGPGGGNSGSPSTIGTGGGGGGYGGYGGAGHGAGGDGGPSYGSFNSSYIEMGSGGGTGGDYYGWGVASGGAGGAAVALYGTTCSIRGTVTMNGKTGGSVGDGRQGPGGGGSGGGILINCTLTDISSSILRADGGGGGSETSPDNGKGGGGGGGAGGRIKIFYDSLTNVSTSPTVNGGLGGQGDTPSGTWEDGLPGSEGTIYYELVDVTPPDAPVISSSTHAEYTWVSNNDSAFNWTVPPDASGIAGYSFSYDAVPDDVQDTADTSVTYYDLSEGTHTFYVKAKDNANHWGAYDSYVFKIDTVSPTTTDDALAETQTQYFTVTLTPYDENSGISATRYRVDGGYWGDIEPILIGTDGTHTIEYYSVDNIGNVEPTKTATVTLERVLEGGDSFTYDANGNMVQGPGGLYYEYNDANQLKRVMDGGPTGPIIAEYWYDHTGKRIKKNESGVVTYYWTDTFEQTVYPNGTVVNTTYYFANGERLAKKVDTNSGSTTYYFHPDHLGSTSVVSNESGNLVEETEYYPYGSTKEGGSEQYLFTGKELDKSTGLYYYGARYYNPELTRFVAADPLVQDPYDPQNLNRYAYVRDNPLKYTDPTGNYFLTTGIDIASLAISIHDIRQDPANKWNWVALTADVATLALPVVAGGGMGVRAVKAGKGVSKIGKYMPSGLLRKMGYSEGFVNALKGGANVVDYAKTSRGTVWLTGERLSHVTERHLTDFQKTFKNPDLTSKEISQYVRESVTDPTKVIPGKGGALVYIKRYSVKAGDETQTKFIQTVVSREGKIITSHPVSFTSSKLRELGLGG